MDTPFLLTLICLRLNSRCSKKKKSDIEKERSLALVIDWPVKTYPNKRMNWTKIIWSVPNRTWIKIFNNQFFNTKYDTQFDDRSINSIMGRKYSLKEVSSDDHCPWENTLTPSNLLSQFHPSSSYLLISIINQILKLQVKLSMSWFLVFFFLAAERRSILILAMSLQRIWQQSSFLLIGTSSFVWQSFRLLNLQLLMFPSMGVQEMIITLCYDWAITLETF